MHDLVPEALLPRQLHARLNPAIPVEWCLEVKIEVVLGTLHRVGNAGRAGLNTFLKHEYMDQRSTGLPIAADHRGKAPR